MDQIKVILDTPDGEGVTAMGLVILPIGPTNGALKRQMSAAKAVQRQVSPLHLVRRESQLVSALTTPRVVEPEPPRGDDPQAED